MSELPHYCEESGEELELDGDYLQTPTVKEHTQGIMWTKSKMLVSKICTTIRFDEESVLHLI